MAKHTVELEADLDTSKVQSKIDALNAKGIPVTMKTDQAEDAIDKVADKLGELRDKGTSYLAGLEERFQKAFESHKVIMGLRQIANELDRVSNIFENLSKAQGGDYEMEGAGQAASGAASTLRSGVNLAVTGQMLGGPTGAGIGFALGSAVGALEQFTSAVQAGAQALEKGQQARSSYLKEDERKAAIAAGTSEISVEKRQDAESKLAELNLKRAQKIEALKGTERSQFQQGGATGWLEDKTGKTDEYYGKSLTEQVSSLRDLDQQIADMKKIIAIQDQGLKKKEKDLQREQQMGEELAAKEQDFAEKLREEEQKKAEEEARKKAKQAEKDARAQEAAAKKAAKAWEQAQKAAVDASKAVTSDFARALTTSGQIGGYMSNAEYGLVTSDTTIQDPQLQELQEQTKILEKIDNAIQSGEGFGAAYA